MDNLDRIRRIAENLIGSTGPVILELCDRVQNEDIRPLAEAVGALTEEVARRRAAESRLRGHIVWFRISGDVEALAPVPASVERVYPRITVEFPTAEPYRPSGELDEP